jgi:hypothetical protein
MTTDPRPWDVTELGAGNARGLTEAADAIGVDLPDLVKLRRRLGTATKHRRPTLIDRLFRRS